MTIALDTETTGIDFRHGARPFFVTTCDVETGEVQFWDWTDHIDPHTRAVTPPESDIDEIAELLSPNCHGNVVGQNLKFDVHALASVRKEFGEYWRWEDTDDTLVMAHVLHSNQPKNLTALGVRWIGVNIEDKESKLQEACNAARRLCRQKAFKEKWGEFAIASPDRDDMPSCPKAKKESKGDGDRNAAWKFDMWLPAYLYRNGMAPDRPEWDKLLADYSNTDSEITAVLFKRLSAEIDVRSRRKHYDVRMKTLAATHRMERNGITIIQANIDELLTEYTTEIADAGRKCVNIARSVGADLVMPKGASPNNSLRSLMFDTFGLERVYSAKSKTGEPTLNKDAMEHYGLTLDPTSKAGSFVRLLQHKRKRDTAVGYMESYKSYWRPWTKGVYRLHPSFNMTGTDTLRFSCENPNAQNISKQETNCKRCDGDKDDRLDCPICQGTGKDLRSVRYGFGPGKGRVWYSNDAKNIELRIPFYKCGQQELINLFERPDDPPYYGSNHLANFHAVYPDVWDAVFAEVGFGKVGPTCKKRFASSYYQWCKNGGFAKQYGAQKKKTDATFKRDGAFDLMEAKFSKLTDYNREQIRYANKYGYVETVPDKTVDPDHGYPLLCTRTENGSVLPTVPLSYHVQGTAMWWMHKAMIRCQDQLDSWRDEDEFDGFMTIQVHDEIVFDFPAGAAHDWRIKRLAALMAEGGNDIGIPTPVGCERHDHNWAEGITVAV